MTWLNEQGLLREAALVGAATTFSAREMAKSAQPQGHYHFFLSHSKIDERLVLAVRNRLTSRGYRVYVDWLDDPQLDRSSVTPRTAAVLRDRMDKSDGMLYLVTQSSTTSTWMPWELGYFDGRKGTSRVGIVPITRARGGQYDGNEYIGLYPHFQDPGVPSFGPLAEMTKTGQVARTVDSLLRN